MKVQFISSFSVIAREPAASRPLFLQTFGLPLEPVAGTDYYASETIGGCKHFGIWPLTEAAMACFGTATWPVDRPVPQASLEVEVGSEAEVATAAAELRAAGYTLLHDARKEPWGQSVARVQSVDGLIVGVSFAPWMH
jgi:hypothetical protein